MGIFYGRCSTLSHPDEKMPYLDEFHKIVYFNHFDNGSSIFLNNERYYIKEKKTNNI